MKRYVLSITVLAFIFTLFSAQPSNSAQQKGVFRNIIKTFRLPGAQEQKNIAQQLNATPQQRTQLKALTVKYQKEGNQLLAEYNKCYNAVVNLMNATSPDVGRINSTLKRFHQVHSNLVNKEVEYWNAFKGILTKEQNKKFWNMFEKSRVRR